MPSSPPLSAGAASQPDPLAQGTGIFSQDSSGDDCGGGAAAGKPPPSGPFDPGRHSGLPASRRPASQPLACPARQQQTAGQAADVIDLTDDGHDEAVGAVSWSRFADAGAAPPELQIAPRWAAFLPASLLGGLLPASLPQPRRLLS